MFNFFSDNLHMWAQKLTIHVVALDLPEHFGKNLFSKIANGPH